MSTQVLQSILAQLPLSSMLALLLGALPYAAGKVAAYVAGYIRSDKFNRYVNAIIAGATILVFAALSIIIADAVAGQWAFSLQAIQASVVILAFGQMRPLMLDVQSVVGFTSSGFVLLPPQKPLVVATRAQSEAQLLDCVASNTNDARPTVLRIPVVTRTSDAVQPVRKVNLSAIQPIDDNPHAG